MKKIAIINGPNLNLLGQREVSIYGSMSFEDYFEKLKKDYANIELIYFQSNIEGELINTLQSLAGDVYAFILNPGGYAHSSVALHDTILAIKKPCIEVHISHVFQREEFRKNLITAAAATGFISGFGLDSYRIALDALLGNK